MQGRRLLMALLLGITCMGAYWISSSWKGPAAAEPEFQFSCGLAVKSAYLHVGEVWEQSEFRYELPLENRTQESIKVDGFSSSCTCASIEPRSLTIPAGECRRVRLTLDLTRKVHSVEEPTNTFTVEIIPFVKSSRSRTRGWQVHGVVKSRVTLNASSMDFGEEAVQGEPFPRRKVEALAHVPCGSLVTSAQPDIVAVDVVRVGDDSKRFEVYIAPKPDLKPGPFRSWVNLEVISSDGKRLSGAKLSVSGQVKQPVWAVPSKVQLPLSDVGETAEAVVVLQSPAGVMYTVEKTHTDSKDVEVSPATSGVISGNAFSIRMRTSKLGDQCSIVNFHVRMQGGQQLVVPVEVFSRGLETEHASVKGTRRKP